MKKYPPSIQGLIDIFSTLPTVGQKTAERYVFYLLKKNPEELKKFANTFSNLKNNLTACRICGSISETDPCRICADIQRDKNIICVVADFRDLLTIETTRQFIGVYHVLGGTIDLINQIGSEQLNINNLINRLNQHTKEIIVALNPDMEGETTAMHLIKTIKQLGLKNIKITRLAKGLPMGADLEYADEMTLTNALKYKNEV